MTEPIATEKLEKIENKIDQGLELSPEEQKLVESSPEDAPDEMDPDTVVLKKEEKTSKAADTPAEKDAEAAKAKEKEAADTTAAEVERKKSIEAAAEKPLDEVDITGYSPTERALFFELRKERRKRQDSQRETDTLKFQRAKEEAREQLEREKAEAEAKATEEAEHDPFNGLDDDDLLTAAQLKKILAGKKEAPAAPAADQRLQTLQMENWVLRAKEKAPDLNLVLPYADKLLINDEDAKAEVADVHRRGGNVVLATYNLVKAHPDWPAIEAKLKAEGGKTDVQKKIEEEARTNQERAERIETNKKKPVTTGAGGGAAASGDYTIQELLDMPEAQFGKLPKSQRDRILETF